MSRAERQLNENLETLGAKVNTAAGGSTEDDRSAGSL